MIDLENALTPLRPDYLDVATNLIDALADDARVTTILLSGSVATETADVHSDLDLSVIVADADAVAPVVSQLPGMISDLVHTDVLARGPVRVFTAITSQWLRIDVLVESLAVATKRAQPPHVVVLDRTDIADRLRIDGREPPAGHEQPVDDPVRLVEAFLRVLGLLDVVTGRAEYFVATQGVMLLREYLVDLFYLENGHARRSGHKRLGPDLTHEQIAVLTAQPALSAGEESVVHGHVAAAHAFLPRARALLAERGLDWPERFDAATRRHLDDVRPRAGWDW